MPEDFHEKTEEPTPKKLADARTKGYVAKSQDLITSIHLILCILVFFFFSGFMFNQLAAISRLIFLNLNFNFTDMVIVETAARLGLAQIAYILLPLFSIVVIVGVSMNILQTGFILSSYPIVPKWSKINIFNPSNYEHNFGAPAFVRLGLGFVRLQIVLAFCLLITGQEAFHIFNLGKGTVDHLITFIKDESVLVSMGIAVGYLFVSIADFFYQKWFFHRKMRMSKREVKDELKQVEGDINVKYKIRSTMRARAQANAINQVNQANILIADGSMYAVALKYKKGVTPVPVCLCKGVHSRAVVIRDLAMRYAIPIIENPTLARKLFREIESGCYITANFYQEVAASLVLTEN